MKIAVFWVVAPCSLVEVYSNHLYVLCLHLRGTVLKQRGTFVRLLVQNT
jgi:hypothetical protein